MGTKYYDVREVIKIGKKLNFGDRSKQPKIKEGEGLVGLLDNGLYLIAPDLTNPDYYGSFYKMYYGGHFLDFSVLAVPLIELEKCPNGPRIDTKEYEELIRQNPLKTENRY